MRVHPSPQQQRRTALLLSSWAAAFLVSILLVTLVTLALATATAADEIDNETCLSCHSTEGFAGPNNEPLYIAPKGFADSVHASLTCQTCHADVTSIPHEQKPETIGPKTCAMCHGDVVDTYNKSIHGEERANGDRDAATCTSCHGSPHEIRKYTDPSSPVYPLNLPRTCGVCHGNPDLAKRHGISVVNAYELYMDSIHGRALTRSGLLVAANCSSCHGYHDILPKNDPKSSVYRGNVPATCGKCHAGVEEAYFKGTHGEALKAGNEKAPVCVNCHTAHQIARVDTERWKLLVVKECGTCHEQSLETYRDTFHGQVTALGFTPVARCSDCHGSHDVLPASNPASSIAPANLVTTCRRCHPDANANFVQFSPHADPHDRDKNPGLYWITMFMNALIIGVFAFFGLHTLLWFIRSLIDQRRKPPGPRASGTSKSREEQ